MKGFGNFWSGNICLVYQFFIFPDGLRPTISFLRATPVSSVTSASGCCTMMLKETSWGISWPTPMWTVVHLTNASLWWTAWITDLMLYTTVGYFIFRKEMFCFLKTDFRLQEKCLFYVCFWTVMLWLLFQIKDLKHPLYVDWIELTAARQQKHQSANNKTAVTPLREKKKVKLDQRVIFVTCFI